MPKIPRRGTMSCPSKTILFSQSPISIPSYVILPPLVFLCSQFATLTHNIEGCFSFEASHPSKGRFPELVSERCISILQCIFSDHFSSATNKYLFCYFFYFSEVVHMYCFPFPVVQILLSICFLNSFSCVTFSFGIVVFSKSNNQWFNLFC